MPLSGKEGETEKGRLGEGKKKRGGKKLEGGERKKGGE